MTGAYFQIGGFAPAYPQRSVQVLWYNNAVPEYSAQYGTSPYPYAFRTPNPGQVDPAMIGPHGLIIATVVPEPSTIALLGSGAISLLAYGWRRQRAHWCDRSGRS